MISLPSAFALSNQGLCCSLSESMDIVKGQVRQHRGAGWSEYLLPNYDIRILFLQGKSLVLKTKVLLMPNITLPKHQITYGTLLLMLLKLLLVHNNLYKIKKPHNLTTACFPPVENFFLDIILTANLSQDPLAKASLTSPHAPLKK